MVALVQVFPKTNQTAVQILRNGSDRDAVVTEAAASEPVAALDSEEGAAPEGSAPEGSATEGAAPEGPATEGVAPEGNGDSGESEPQWTTLDELEFGEISLLGWTFDPGNDSGKGLLVMALLAGILGSFMHAAQSLTSYVGNKKFKSSWILWYVLRAPIGAVLGVFMYFVLRAGLLSANSEIVSPYGVVTLAGLGGWFSKQATDKLAELFDRFFESGTDAKRDDKLSTVAPAVTAATATTDADEDQ